MTKNLRLLFFMVVLMIALPFGSVWAADSTASPPPKSTDGKEASSAAAMEQVNLVLDGKELHPPVPARIVDNYTLVPIRVLIDEFGATINWNNEVKKLTIEDESKIIELYIGQNSAYIDGTEISIPTPPIIDKGTTLVPLRFVTERFGVEFKFDSTTKTVHMARVLDPDVIDEENEGATEEGESNNGSSGNPGNTDENKGEQSKPLTVTGIEVNELGIVIQTDAEQVNPTVFKLKNPDRLVFDVPNALLAPSIAEQLGGVEGRIESDHPLIDQVRFSQFSKDPAKVRVTLDLRPGARFYMIPNSPKGQVAAEITRTAIPSHKYVEIDGVKKYIVVLDAGHGGKDPGAKSVIGRNEKDFTLSMVKKVGEILEQEEHLLVMYTRSDDTFVELDDRAAFANDNNAAIFLSIHGNSYLSHIHGIETYYWRDDSIDLAEIIHDYALQASGFADRNVRKNNYRVVTKTTMPAVLLEAGYLSNADEANQLYDEAFQNKLAKAIAEGIKEFAGLK